MQFQPIVKPGVEILDSFQQICIWDKSAAKLDSYSLKRCTLTLGLRDSQRLELSASEIQECWRLTMPVAGGQSQDLATLEKYLKFDLEDTQLLADFLLPVVYYQLCVVPEISFQDLAIASLWNPCRTRTIGLRDVCSQGEELRDRPSQW